jgi:Ricin-type beta-trefoil lectin domain-like
VEFFAIQSRSSGKMLDLPGFAWDNGVRIQQYRANGGVNQCWTLQPTDGGFVKIVSPYRLKVLDVPGFATDDGVRIQQYSDNGGTNQQWRLEANNEGFHKIRCRSSGKVLDVPGFATDDGVWIQQFSDNGGTNQQWRLVLVGNGATKEFHFTLESFEIENTRSRHEDTDYVSCTLAVGNSALKTKTAALGDLNNGTHNVALSFGPVTVAPNEAVIFNYLILNSGHQNEQATQEVLTKAGVQLAEAGAKAAAEAIGSGAGSLVGASIGSAVVPVIGTALGALAGWIAGELGALFFANCDGPVAAEQVAMTGAELAAHTASGQPYRHTTSHTGTDSPHGCGSNSKYKVTWQITAIG